MTLALIYPLLAQVLLTFLVLFAVGFVRNGALKRSDVTLKEIALSSAAWPDRVRQFGNNFSNQFETPVLFYVLVLAALHTGATNIVTIVLAWLFVASRVVHTLIHVTGNDVRLRSAAFMAGVVALFGIWLVIVLKLLSSHM